MSAEPLPLSKVAKTLETCSGYEFQVVLKTISSAKYVDDKLLKADLAVLVAKILKLLRSSDDYLVWKGCKLSDVLCSYNAVVLCSQAGHLLTALFNKMEQKAGFYRTTVSSTQGKTVLFSLVRSVDILLDLIRGKPALTREVLTPRLPAIITVLVNLAQFEPELCCPVLKKILVKNTTTFRPHINKYNNVIVTLIVKDYNHFNKHTRKLILENYALLHLLKQNSAAKDDSMRHHKAHQDEQWRQGIMHVLCSFKPVISLCGEILDFSADEDMRSLLNRLPSSSDDSKNFLPPVKVDLNKPTTLWAIADRLELLCDLTLAFVSQHTPFRMRVPLGGIATVAEAILSLTTNYLPLQRLLRRDAELTATIYDLLPTLQASGISLLGSLSRTYGKSLLSYTPSILGSLEYFIPIKQGTTSIDFDKVDTLKYQFFELFTVVDIFLNHTGHLFSETTLFTKLIDIALHLTKDLVPLKHLYQQQNPAAKTNSQKSKKAGKQNTGSMSDVYSHPQAFIDKCSVRNLESLNQFLVRIVVNLKLQSAQQIKIARYAITVASRAQRELGRLPSSFAGLLQALVMHPGYEKVSILPIAVTLLKSQGDDVLDVFCNPRLPVAPVQSVKRLEEPMAALEKDEERSLGEQHDEDEEMEQADEITEAVKEVARVVEEDNNPQPSNSTTYFDQLKEDKPESIMRKRSVDIHERTQETKIRKTEQVLDSETRSIPVEVIEKKQTVVEVHEKDESDADDDDDDDSEFEIPEINLSEDDEE
ncbi:LAFA_0F10550g1_1 [Lachancea sp. 'fantastica']|nr:LAFA_0F10550g1_1 [Lachancea sp. 'fantastica']